MRKSKHGKTKHPAYSSWTHMRSRCNNPNNGYYHRYGGRGIGICKEWDDAGVFCDWADKNGFTVGLTIHRVDNDLDYSPENCIWANDEVQSNEKGNNRYLTINNKTQSLSRWAREPNAVGEETIRYRIKSGWDHEDAVFRPIGISINKDVKIKNNDIKIGDKIKLFEILNITKQSNRGRTKTIVKVKCKCGKIIERPLKVIVYKYQSCGCLKNENARNRMIEYNKKAQVI